MSQFAQLIYPQFTGVFTPFFGTNPGSWSLNTQREFSLLNEHRTREPLTPTSHQSYLQQTARRFSIALQYGDRGRMLLASPPVSNLAIAEVLSPCVLATSPWVKSAACHAFNNSSNSANSSSSASYSYLNSGSRIHLPSIWWWVFVIDLPAAIAVGTTRTYPWSNWWWNCQHNVTIK